MRARTLGFAIAIAAALMMPGLAAAQEEAADAPVTCLDGVEGYLRMSLSGAVNTRLFWENAGTACEGTAHENDLQFSFDRTIVEGMGGAGLTITMQVFGITTGQTGENLRVLMTLESNQFATGIYRSGEGNCNVSVQKNELLGSMGIAQLWHIEGTGLCSGPATSAGGAPINISDFQFSGAYAAISLGGE